MYQMNPLLPARHLTNRRKAAMPDLTDKRKPIDTSDRGL